MNGNVAGLLVVAIGMFAVVMGIKGSQHALFPQLFGATGTNTPVYNAPNAGTGASGSPDVPPGPKQSCPPGYIFIPGINACQKVTIFR